MPAPASLQRRQALGSAGRGRPLLAQRCIAREARGPEHTPWARPRRPAGRDSGGSRASAPQEAEQAPQGLAVGVSAPPGARSCRIHPHLHAGKPRTPEQKPGQGRGLAPEAGVGLGHTEAPAQDWTHWHRVRAGPWGRFHGSRLGVDTIRPRPRGPTELALRAPGTSDACRFQGCRRPLDSSPRPRRLPLEGRPWPQNTPEGLAPSVLWERQRGVPRGT